MPDLFHHLVTESAARNPEARALRYQEQNLSYAQLNSQLEAVAQALLALGAAGGDRVAVYLEKRVETVVTMFGASAAGLVFVPLNPLLKAAQVAYQLNDCGVRILITSAQRLAAILPALLECPNLQAVIITDSRAEPDAQFLFQVISWEQAHQLAANNSFAKQLSAHRRIDHDIAAILYTSGSTGHPKGVVVSHRNLVAGAEIVAGYLHNTAHDNILCVLPFSFDYGLSQLTTAMYSGATAVLFNYLLPADIPRAVRAEDISGLAGIPPLWIQLAQLDWSGATSLRYLTNSGGAMPAPTLAQLRRNLPDASIYLMYGLTEAFRSTFLDPQQIDARPGSIGKAIPNNEVLVLRGDGSVCAPNEPGELVHRGVLVTLGYWNAAELTAQRFKPLPTKAVSPVLPELAVWSGDIVRQDEEGYLYYLGRADEQIKVSGYRISPQEVEEILFRYAGIGELAVIAVPHPVLGQALIAVVLQTGSLTAELLKRHCQQLLPSYMVPSHIEIYAQPLPRNANGKIDRAALRSDFSDQFSNKIEAV